MNITHLTVLIFLIIYLGIIFSTIGLTICIIVQHQMKLSWRIGIDKENDTNLVTKGLFQYSRNPIYLGLMIAYLGYFLVIPNAATLLLCILSCVLLSQKIRFEEEHLFELHPKEYPPYYKRVRRWL